MKKKKQEKNETIYNTADGINFSVNNGEPIMSIRPDGNIEFAANTTLIFKDGYGNHVKQLNIKLTEKDISTIKEINKEFFDNEISDSTLGRILLRRGIKSFNKIK